MLNVYIYMYIYIYIGWWPFKTSQPGSIQDMTSVELQLCYDEYREDPEVQHWWSKAGVENSLMMHLGWEKDGKRMGKGWEKDGKRMGKGWEFRIRLPDWQTGAKITSGMDGLLGWKYFWRPVPHSLSTSKLKRMGKGESKDGEHI